MQHETPPNLCLNCMSDMGGAAPCTGCGWKPGAAAQSPIYLTPGTILREQYVVGRVLGHGGFGITYLGWDLNLARKIAIKEYFPGGVGMRASGSPDVFAYSPTLRADYDWGLDRYLEEARVVARFENHPNVVWVLNFFAAHGTAYIILEYLDGATFESYLQRAGGKVDWAIAMRVISPVIDALREVHRAGLLHRDVSPDNIYLLRNGQVKVIDFGAARYSLGQHSKNLSVILKPGFAPPEQYQTRGNQGPWTDVYATACTLYRALTGEVPPPAPDRMAKVPLVPPSQRGINIAPAAEQALLRALALEPEERFADMDEFRRALQGEVVAPIPVVAPPVPAPTPVPLPKPSPLPPPGPLSFFEKMAITLGLPAWLLGAAAGVLALVAIVAVIPKPKPPVEEPHREKSKGEDQTKGGEQNKTPVIVEKPNDGPVDGGPHKGGKDEGKEKKPDDSKVPPFDGSIKPGPEKKIPARITAFEFKPDRIERGQSTELRWSVEGATHVTLDGVAVELSGRRTLKPNDDLRARLTADTPTGTLERTAVVSVVEPPPPPIPKPIQTGSWSVYHHHGIGVASFMIDWGQLRNPRAVVRGEKDPCFGTLSLSGTRLRFDSLSSNDSFTTELSNIDKVEINRNRIAGETAFQVKIHKGKNYNFVPRQSVQSVVGSIRSAMSR